LDETPNHGRKNEIQTELSRDLGLVSALSIGVGTMIAAGIFTLSGLAVAKVGSAAIVSFLLAAAVASFTALTYCEFSSIYPQSGEGYLYARKTFAPPLAYMVGWCLLLGYTSSCAFYIASLSTYFNEFIWHAPYANLSGLLAVAALTLLNVKGTKESGNFQIAVTAGKIILLIWFIAGGLGRVDTALLAEKFSTDVLRLGSTAAMVFITFFGFSAIAASAGEVQSPTKTIPRAIFISMGVVTVLYCLVILVVVSADLNLSRNAEAAMGTAAKIFLGPIGGMVIVAGALFSMVSASNASIMAGSRVALSMSQLGHLPREIGTINARTRTPTVSLLLVGACIAAFATLLPLEKLAHFADCILLVALILVNAALIIHRRLEPDLKRPFRVPLVPLLPALGIAANVYLLTQIVLQGHEVPAMLAALSLILGFLGFLAWKGAQDEEVALPGEPSRLALEQSAMTESPYRVLVPIANPDNVEPLIDIASAVARQREGEIVALRVVLVPEQLPPSVDEKTIERGRQDLESARVRARENGIPITSLVCVGHYAARAILETCRERDCDLIVLGWKGSTSTARRILGEVTDDVMTHARADIMLVKLMGEARPIRNLLLPSAGGEHAQRAEEYAADIAAAQQGSLALCSVVAPEAPEERVQSEEERLGEDLARIELPGDLSSKVIRSQSVVEGILEESENYDAVVVGATASSFTTKMFFGSIPENVARRADRPVIMVKRHHAVASLVRRVMTD